MGAQLGGRLWENSLARSKPDVELITELHDFGAGNIQTWWGPVLPVERGSMIHYFMGPYGITVEWIDPPQEH